MKLLVFLALVVLVIGDANPWPNSLQSDSLHGTSLIAEIKSAGVEVAVESMRERRFADPKLPPIKITCRIRITKDGVRVCIRVTIGRRRRDSPLPVEQQNMLAANNLVGEQAAIGAIRKKRARDIEIKCTIHIGPDGIRVCISIKFKRSQRDISQTGKEVGIESTQIICDDFIAIDGTHICIPKGAL